MRKKIVCVGLALAWSKCVMAQQSISMYGLIDLTTPRYGMMLNVCNGRALADRHDLSNDRCTLETVIEMLAGPAAELGRLTPSSPPGSDVGLAGFVFFVPQPWQSATFGHPS
jgi:hypothetical protein